MVRVSTASNAVPKPSVPEFTLKVVAHPYDVPPTYEIDQYTGQNIKTSSGYHVENKSVEVIIKNQPFSSTLDESGNYTSLFYNIQFKGHYANEWSHAEVCYNTSNSAYTLISISFEGQDIPDGGQIDFQVRALVGHLKRLISETGILVLPNPYYYEFAGKAGDWSNTQTITIDQSASTTTPSTPSSQSPSNTNPDMPSSQNSTTATPIQSNSENVILYGLSWDKIAIIILASIVAILLVVVVVCLHKGKKHVLSSVTKLTL